LVPVAGKRCPATGKVTVGLASHWPCVTDLSGLSTYGLKAYVGKITTTPTLLAQVQVQVQVFIDTLAAQRPNNLTKREKVLKHVSNTINQRNEEKGQAH